MNLSNQLSNLNNALQLRGFLVNNQQNEHIYISQGNHAQDIRNLIQLFEQHNIPATIHNGNIYLQEEQLQTNHIDFNKIIWHPAQNHEAGGNGQPRGFRYFTKSIHGPKIRTLTLETGIARMVKAISAAGITTINSCDGHGKRAPIVNFFGTYNASWFYVQFQKMLQETKTNLNYQWIFTEEEKALTDPGLKGVNPTRSKYNLDLVLEDSLQIADYFFNNAQAISETKRTIFRKNRNTLRKQVKDMTFDQLCVWMETREQEYTSLISN
ncbi:hypothetical protein J2S74_000746 [Evansella vedderi]|uniref:Uncharacterized protein n=1 Tax=Evansella vedderi TaxID=38282 RepID=A0ABT9ZR80_9BACI|nr:hypothetical protein [Evansella vedderi]MDQ0253374.1 hypothetical protein [Evansella vedderi]